MGILEVSRVKLREIIEKNKLHNVNISVLVKTLTPEEAIGEPGRRDFPIIIGKERIIEAELLGAKAHAFTDSPGEYLGKLKEIEVLSLNSNKERAIYIATLNATLKYLNLIKNTLHCKNESPLRCAEAISSHLLRKWGKVKVGLIGLNPAICERLVSTFGKKNVYITDLNKENINSIKNGVEVWDGNIMTEEIMRQSDVALITGTTLGNGTFDDILNCILNYKREYLIYGVTAVGICKLMGFNRICPYGRAQ